MKVLVTGGGGQVASTIADCFPVHWEIRLFSHAELEISDSSTIQYAIGIFSPDVVINTAAFTAVDEAERYPEQALYANAEAVAILAMICNAENIPLIHLSTDYIFDGEQSVPYKETDRPNPINIYGLSKLKGEEAIRELCERHIILRVSSVFSQYGNNFVKTILRLAEQREELKIVSDQIHCPTSGASIALALKIIIENLSDNIWGTYHYCGSPSTTWFEFAQSIVQLGHQYQRLKTKMIQPISSVEFNLPALRPRYSVLNCDRMKAFFGFTQLNWAEDLDRVVRDVCE